jgi:hypothetical protein
MVHVGAGVAAVTPLQPTATWRHLIGAEFTSIGIPPLKRRLQLIPYQYWSGATVLRCLTQEYHDAQTLLNRIGPSTAEGAVDSMPLALLCRTVLPTVATRALMTAQ